MFQINERENPIIDLNSNSNAQFNVRISRSTEMVKSIEIIIVRLQVCCVRIVFYDNQHLVEIRYP